MAEPLLITADAFLFLTATAAFVLASCAWCLVRRRRDSARSWTVCLKMTFTVFALCVTLALCAYTLSTAYALLALRHRPPIAHLRDIIYAISYIRPIVHFLDLLSDMLVFLTFVSLGIDIGVVHTGKPCNTDKALRLASYGLAAVLLLLILVTFAITEYIYAEYYNADLYRYGISNGFLGLWNSDRQIEFSVAVLFFVLAVAVVLWSFLIKMNTRSEKRVKTATTFLIICSLLWLLETTYDIAQCIKYVNLKDVMHDRKLDSYLSLLDVFFSVWPKFTLLSILFALGVKKRNGLWFTEPQCTTNQCACHLDQNQMVPMQQQQQQQQAVQPASPYPDIQPVYYPSPGMLPQPQADMQSISPPSHHEAMGLNHQADGTPPQAPTMPYDDKQ